VSPVRFLVAPQTKGPPALFCLSMRPIHHIAHQEELRYAWDSIRRNRKVFLIADSNTLSSCFPILAEAQPDFGACEIIEIEPGEESKSWSIAESIIQRLLELQADKNTLIVALGGGMVTDLVGFVAAVYKRGVSCVLIPTSLLAMVDASIGGKTALNIQSIKNAVGTITEPEAILIYPGFLNTLPTMEIQSGLGEMLKHAILDSEGRWDQLLNDWKDESKRFELIRQSAEIKWKIVEADPREHHLRQQLNIGHTFGHAIESASFSMTENIAHGKAVALGLMIEATLAVQIGKATSQFADKIRDGILHLIPLSKSIPSFDQLLPYLRNDKKNQGDAIRFSLATGFGAFELGVEIQEDDLRKAYNTEVKELFSKKL
jgi:3-dehydroquinate synthase